VTYLNSLGLMYALLSALKYNVLDLFLKHLRLDWRQKMSRVDALNAGNKKALIDHIRQGPLGAKAVKMSDAILYGSILEMAESYNNEESVKNPAKLDEQEKDFSH